MKAKRYFSVVVKNLLAIGIFAMMLSVAKSKYEIMVVCGMALIYTMLKYYAVWIIRILLSADLMESRRFMTLAALLGKPEHGQAIAQLENSANQEWRDILTMEGLYYIDATLNAVIWAVALVEIITVVFGS